MRVTPDADPAPSASAPSSSSSSPSLAVQSASPRRRKAGGASSHTSDHEEEESNRRSTHGGDAGGSNRPRRKHIRVTLCTRVLCHILEVPLSSLLFTFYFCLFFFAAMFLSAQLLAGGVTSSEDGAGGFSTFSLKKVLQDANLFQDDDEDMGFPEPLQPYLRAILELNILLIALALPLSLFCTFLHFIPLFRQGQTPGKWAMGVQFISKRSGKVVGFCGMCLRFVLRWVLQSLGLAVTKFPVFELIEFLFLAANGETLLDKLLEQRAVYVTDF